MKPIFLFFLFSSMCLNAQTEQGTLMPGGSISFQTSESGSVFSFSPSLGYFVANSFALGTSLTLAAGNDQTIWAFGPSVRKYFGKNPKGKLFLGASGLIVGGSEFIDPDLGYGVTGGYAIFLNPSIALEIGIDYFNNTFGGGMVSIGTGFRIHFRSNKKRGE